MGMQRIDHAVNLREMLEARETRVSKQQRLLREYGLPLLSFTMNLAGPVKRGRLGDLLFWTPPRGWRHCWCAICRPKR